MKFRYRNTEFQDRRVTWWLPESEDRRVAGTVSYASDGVITIYLDHPLLDAPERTPTSGRHYRVLFGADSEGILLTAIDCHCTQFTVRSDGPGEEHLHARVVLAGVHCSEPKTPAVTEISISCPDLADWFEWTCFTRDGLEDGSPVSDGIRFEMPPPMGLNVARHGIAIDCVALPQSTSSLRQKWTIEQKNWLHVSFSEPRPLDDALATLKKVRDLIRLFQLQPPLVSEIRVRLVELKGASNMIVSPPLSAMVRQDNLSAVLIPYPAIQDEFGAILEKWLDDYPRFAEFLELYFGCIEDVQVGLTVRLMNMMQAIESFHRLTRNGKYIDEDAYQAVYSTMVSAIPGGINSDLRSALTSRLKYGNERSLRWRLRDLIRSLDGSLQQLLPNKAEVFANQIVDIRNYLVHRDEASKPRTLSAFALYEHLRMLRMLLFTLMCQRLDVPASAIIKGADWVLNS